MSPELKARFVQVEKGTLDYIVAAVVHTFNPSKLILFGSRAEGRATEESDMDLLVVHNALIDPRDTFDFTSRLSDEVGIPVQLILITKEVYEETKDIIGGIAYPATKYGMVIYEKP